MDDVGDVNGDGMDDLGVQQEAGCGPNRTAIVFGGARGTLSLDALGAQGLTFGSEDVSFGFAPAGDINGDGLEDVALGSSSDLEGALDEIVIVLGRRTAGLVPTDGQSGVVRLRRRSCQDLTEVAPAGDLDGDGDGELLVGVSECEDRELHPVVAQIVEGAPGAGTRNMASRGGTVIRARFGPLKSTRVATGQDVGGGPRQDLALGFPEAGNGRVGEAWLVRDVRLGEQLTLGALGPRGSRIVGSRESSTFATDLAMTPDVTGDGRADLVIGSPQEEFAGRYEAGTAYTYGPRTAPARPCSVPRTGTGLVRGTDVGDLLTGSPGPDRIVGFMGDDCIQGGAGRDRLIGDPGEDRLMGGAGADRLSGGSGRDRLDGGDGPDLLDGGNRGDVINGGRGDDRIDARFGAGDRVDAGPGNDLVRSNEGAGDHINCGQGRDRAVVDPGDSVRGCERLVRRRPAQTD